jgi:hypothetical protein
MEQSDKYEVIYLRKLSYVIYSKTHKQINFLAFCPQAKYTDWATATIRRILMPTFANRELYLGQCSGTPTAVNLRFLDRSRYFSF